jgi:hypothetical protein
MKFVTRMALAAAFALTGAFAPAKAADLEPLLPAETEQLIRVNVRQILESDLIKKYALNQIKQALEGNDAQKQLKELGMDPLKDIDSITGGIWGDDPQNMKFVMIAKGKFDPAKLFEKAEAEAKKDGDKIGIVKDGSYTLVKFTVPNRPDPLFMSVADEKTVLVGSEKGLVTAAMKAAETKSKSVLKKELVALADTVDSKASMSVVALSSGKVGDIPPNPLFDNPEKLKKQLEKMETMAMTVKVTGDITLEVAMGMKDGDAADDFGGTVDELLNKAKAFLPFLAMQSPNMKPVVTDISKSLKSKVEKKAVNITAKLSGDAIGKAAGADD